MWSWRSILPFVLLSIWMIGTGTSPGTAQTTPPTIDFQVIGYGPIAALEHNCPLDNAGKLTRYVPATITCTLRALDAEGLWTPANFSVTLDGPADRVGVEVADSMLTIRILRTTGIAGVRVTIEARPVLSLAMVYPYRPAPYAQVDTIPPMGLLEGEWGKVCAYVGGYGSAIAKGMPADGYNCPDFGPEPLPTFPVSFRPGDGAVLLPPQPVALIARR